MQNRDEILMLYTQGLGYTEIIDRLKLAGNREEVAERIRNVVRVAIKKGEVQRRNLKARKGKVIFEQKELNAETTPPPAREFYEMKADGTITQDKIIEICEQEEKSPYSLMVAHGFDPQLWEVVSYRNNFWHSQQKGGKLLVMGQSRITVRPLKAAITTENIDAYFNYKTLTNQVGEIIPTNYDEAGQTLEICLPDWHAGLLAWREETGQDYDLHIAQERLRHCVMDIVSRCRNKHLKKIYLVTLGDLLHFDNDEQKTTKGTFQQADGRLSKIFDFTLDTLIDFVSILATLAPTEIIYIPGNHDRLTGYMAIKAVEMAFRSTLTVTFDTKPRSEKWRLFGGNLVGWHHGDAPSKNMKNWLQHKARKEFGQARYAEIHNGHLHSQGVRETNRDLNLDGEMSGITIRTLPTIAPSSFWESQQEYSSVLKTLMCFVWHDEIGLREIWYSNIA